MSLSEDVTPTDTSNDRRRAVDELLVATLEAELDRQADRPLGHSDSPNFGDAPGSHDFGDGPTFSDGESFTDH